MKTVFFIPGKPLSKGNVRSFQVKGRTIYVDGNKALKSWEAVAKMILQDYAPDELWDGAVAMELTFFFQEPKATPKGKKGKIPMTKKPDSTKIARSVEDTMTGIIFRDDSQITDYHIRKRYGEKPGVLVRIWQVDGLNDAFSHAWSQAW